MSDNGIELKPDLDHLFGMFAREARLRADIVHTTLPEPTESKVALLRAIHALLVPLNICTQSIHNRETLDRFRELIHEVTLGMEQKANAMENTLAEQEETEA